MASQVDLRLTAPIDEGRELVRAALISQGFAVATTPAGDLDVTRGSLGTTLVAGAFAGQDMHVRFEVGLLPTDSGCVVQVRGSSVGGFMKGGAIGASKANDVVQNAAHELGRELAARGVLEGASSVGAAPFAEAATGGYRPAPATPTSAAWQHGAGVPPPIDYPNRTNVVAIVAIVLGFLFPLGGIIAGAVALAQVKRTGEKGRGLAIGGIVVGSVLTVLYIAVAIIVIVIAVAVEPRTDSGTATPPSATPPSASTPFDDEDAPAQDPETVDVFSLTVGDCLIDPDAEEVLTVEAIDCSLPHDFEVYFDFELEGDEYQGDEQSGTLADDGCRQAFDGFVGIAYEDSLLDYTFYLPTAESWAEGDRLVSCLIFDPAAQAIGSLAGAGY